MKGRAACRGDEKISRRGVLGGMLRELECGIEELAMKEMETRRVSVQEERGAGRRLKIWKKKEEE